MAFKTSTGLRNYMLADASLKDALDSGFLHIYSGTEPATADDAITGLPSSRLCIISINDTGVGLTFQSPAVNGVISKSAGETWNGEIDYTNTATFFRFVGVGDTDALSTTEPRVQGTIGLVGADLNLSNTALVSPGVQTINHFNIALPTL